MVVKMNVQRAFFLLMALTRGQNTEGPGAVERVKDDN
jgi:hypothetical protein